MKISQLAIKDASNKVERLCLDGYSIIIEGQEPLKLDGQWLDIVGVESDNFKEVDLRLKREAVTTEPDKVRSHAEIELLIQSSLIVDWSFEEECNEENKVEFIKSAASALVRLIVRKAESRVSVNFTKADSKA